ncbi:MAG: GNAT family N-acetyltransferase [Chloroflexota bacterium]|nr:GNAT family N-acetyltransferase [Chloroflexota bacterium]
MLEVRAVCEEELAAVALCIARAFRSDPDDIRGMVEYFHNSLSGDTIPRLENTRVAVLDGRVVSVVLIHDRQMLVRGVPVRLGFPPLVGTDPDHQGHGYGALLLWDSAEYMRREGYHVSLISTETERFYERGGWSNFGHYHKLTLRIPEAIPAATALAGEVRPANLRGDLDPILAIFSRNNRDASGPAVRTRRFWEEFAANWAFDYPIYHVAAVGRRIVAYLRNGYGRRLVEFGVLPGAEEAGFSLILHACREAPGSGGGGS